MTDNEKKHLMMVTVAETAEFEKMADVIRRKHEAIAKLDTINVQGLVSEELVLLNNIRIVEKERSDVLKSMMLSAKDLNDEGAITAKLGNEDSATYRKLHAEFQNAFNKVVQLNNMSRILLLHSLAFIRKNISILTNDGNRRLVDRRA